jgi:hypothetical protein
MSDSSLPSSSPQPAVANTEIKRGGCLTTLLVFFSIGSISVLFQVAYPQFMDFVSSLSGSLFLAVTHLISALCVMVICAGLYGIWTWKKWGIYLTLGTTPVSYATYVVYTGFSVAYLLMMMVVFGINIALWYFALRSKWRYFH